jgi:hypothetical protein
MPDLLPEVPHYEPICFKSPYPSGPFNPLPGGGWWMSHEEIEDSYGYKLYEHQKEALDCNASTQVWAWCRRASKTMTAGLKAMRHAWAEPGTYAILLPTKVQARAVLIDGKTADDDSVFDRIFPADKIAPEYNHGGLTIPLLNGAKIEINGYDFMDGARLLGVNWKMVFLCEFATVKDALTIYRQQIAPILMLTEGTVIFESAYYGEDNDFAEIWKIARDNRGIVNPRTGKLAYYERGVTLRDFRTLDEEWDTAFLEGRIDPALWRMSYYNKDEISTRHKVYGGLLKNIKLEENLADPNHPLFTAWDIGRGCFTAIWFFQVIPLYDDSEEVAEIRQINFYEKRDEQGATDKEIFGTPFFVEKVKSFAAHFPDSFHYMPHDSDNYIIDRVQTPLAIAEAMGLDIIMLPRCSRLLDRIARVKEFLVTQNIKWDTRCEQGLRRLRQYTWKININGTHSGEVEDNDSKDAADALRYFVDAFLVPGLHPLRLIANKKKALAKKRMKENILQYESSAIVLR